MSIKNNISFNRGGSTLHFIALNIFFIDTLIWVGTEIVIYRQKLTAYNNKNKLYEFIGVLKCCINQPSICQQDLWLIL